MVFTVCHHHELPDVWRGVDQGFLDLAAVENNLPVDAITSVVVFELPDCQASWEYHRWISSNYFPNDIVGVAVSNLQDFIQSHGRDAVTASIRSLRDYGHPCQLMRVCLLRDDVRPLPP